MITVEQLTVYPVKSMAGVNLKHSLLNVAGLQYDRQWSVVEYRPLDPKAKTAQVVSQREAPQLATFNTQLRNDELIIRHQEQTLHIPIDIDEQQRQRLDVSIWGDIVSALDEGEVAANWLTQMLGINGRQYRLVRFDSQQLRQTQQYKNLPYGAGVCQFADGFATLICNRSSLAQLNQHLPKHLNPFAMPQFRPNIVISGMQAWQELQTQTLRVKGHYQLYLNQPCKRCILPHINQQTGQRLDDYEPARTLLKLPPNDRQTSKRKAYFGMNANISIASENAVIAVGDVLIKAN